MSFVGLGKFLSTTFQLYVRKIFLLNGSISYGKKATPIADFFPLFDMIYCVCMVKLLGIGSGKCPCIIIILYRVKLKEDKYLLFTCSAFLIEDLTCCGESLVCQRLADTVLLSELEYNVRNVLIV